MNQASINFKESILKNLSNNGFPMKSVSLPLEKLYEVADEKGANLNDVLDDLAKNGIAHEKIENKIVFRSEMSKGDMMAKAQEMMSKMKPEELERVQEMVKNMSPEEREKMMEQVKKMGLF